MHSYLFHGVSYNVEMTKFGSHNSINLRKAILFVTKIDPCMIKRFQTMDCDVSNTYFFTFKEDCP